MEKIHTDIFASMAEGASHVADKIEAGIKAAQQEGKFYVMALGAGSSLYSVYDELVRRYNEKTLSFRNVVVFNAYEYYPLQKDSSLRTINQLKERFLDHVDVAEQNIFTLDGFVAQDAVQDSCRLYEQRNRAWELINDIPGVSCVKPRGALYMFPKIDAKRFNIHDDQKMVLDFLLQEKVLLVQPGSGIQSMTRIILIGNTSREEMENSEQTKETIPPCSLTMGIATLLSAKSIYLTAWGEEKAEIMQKVVENSITDTLPASFLQTHPNAHVVIDLGAAHHLTRIEHPWLVTSCQWSDKLVRSALVWLCQKLGKPILKLTNKDYNENGLSELLALYGSAYNANIKIFNDLQHTITGWPGGKPNADDTYRPERATPYPKKVIVFSPHPDDDVISMGGTIRRLVQQNHDVHVAYETSGNIAVGDEEVTRFMHFINGFNQLFADSKDSVISNKYKEIKTFFAKKKESDFDTRDILTIKGLIRRGEARTACTYNEIPLDHVHFLDLPFYESGKIEKLPMTEKDVEIVRALLQKVQPHQIYVAGDLADPHGTHKKCTDAVLAAIDEEKKAGAEWLKDCRIWMYRGAWAEWEIENIEMCVPLSPEELRAKRNSILKHQSQMESAPFLGNDERLFWQRAEDRNRATASLYDQLGLACYEAMEAFVEYKPL